MTHPLRLAAVAAVGAVLLAGAVLLTTTAGGRGGGVSAAEGLQTSRAPWPPEDRLLAARLEALDLPQATDFGYHVHAMLRVYVDGRREPVPADIGFDPQDGFTSPLHTHDSTGLVHIESAERFPFTLGQFFTIWGVKFSDRQIGAYRDEGQDRLRVYVNDRFVRDPMSYVMKSHDRIVVGYGQPGSCPTRFRTPFPTGL